MKKLFWYSLIPLTLFTLTGCGNNFPPDRRQFTPPVGSGTPTTLVSPIQNSGRQACKATSDKGCISGQVIVAPYIYLDSQKYFDAEDLGRLFADMVILRDKGGAPTDRSHYKIEIAPKIDNESFIEEFKVYAKGAYAARANLSSKGLFVLSGLDAGTYDLRVQKSFTMKVSQLAEQKLPPPPPVTKEPTTPVTKEPAAPVAKGPTTPIPMALTDGETTVKEPVAKVYCFTIYAQEDQLEVDAGHTLHKVFDHFKLHMIDKECDKEIAEGPILTM